MVVVLEVGFADHEETAFCQGGKIDDGGDSLACFEFRDLQGPCD